MKPVVLLPPRYSEIFSRLKTEKQKQKQTREQVFDLIFSDFQ